MRSAWQAYVSKIRRKGNRGKNTMSHQEAMKLASVTWPKEKAKIERRLKKECKRRSLAKPDLQKSVEPESKNEKTGDD